MKYFIPAWYSKKGYWWHDKARPFYDATHTQTEFDDMVSLLGMHYHNESDYTIINLNLFTDLRTFLYRNQLFESKYWSLFDDIQGFKQTTPKPIDYLDLEWPEGTEFVYTPFFIRAITSKETYTHLYYSESGYLLWLDRFEKNQRISRIVIDDRGMKSFKLIYIDDIEAECVLYHADGREILKVDLRNEIVVIYPEFQDLFKLSMYPSMNDLILERLSLFLTNVAHQHFIVAADERHNTIINNVIPSNQLTYSIFRGRNHHITDTETLQYAHRWIIDTKHVENQLKPFSSTDMLRITPFNTQEVFGISNQLLKTHIGLLIDGLSDSHVLSLIDQLEAYIDGIEYMKLDLITREQRYNKGFVNEKIENINLKYLEMNEDFEDFTDLEVEEVKVIELVSLPFENDVVKKISELRILIDLNEEPDLFFQISCISAGIPQINKVMTDYVEDNVNGIILNNEENLPMALNFYLKTLKNWNHSYTFNLKLAERYTSVNILKQIDAFIGGNIIEKEV